MAVETDAAAAGRDALVRVTAGERLTRTEARELFGAALCEHASADAGAPIVLAGLLVALAQRGETAEELAGAADAVRACMLPFEHAHAGAVDTCGTGGDGLGTVNLSTAAALIAAAAGAIVVKHGNRAVSSRAGSSDVLEALGGVVDVAPETARRALDAVGFTYLHAPRYHGALRRAAPVRRALGLPTLFNLLGPLCNPGRVRRQVVGVASPRRVGLVARALTELRVEAAYVVHGAGGADELTLAGVNRTHAVGAAAPATVDPSALGLRYAPVSALAGGDAAQNAATLRRVLAGNAANSGNTGNPDHAGSAVGADAAVRDAACLNAALALVVAGVATGVAEGLDRAREAIARGAALRVLDTWARITREEVQR